MSIGDTKIAQYTKALTTDSLS